MSTRANRDVPATPEVALGPAGSDDLAGPGSAGGQPRGVADLVRGLITRWWIAVLAALIGFAAGAAYSVRQPVVHTTAATIEILRAPPMVMPIVDVVSAEVVSSEDLNTQIAWLGSRAIAERVARRLSADELRRVTEPFAEDATGDRMADAIEVLHKGRRVVPLRMSLVAAVVFSHPDPDLVPRVANLFAEEFIAAKISTKTSEAFRVADELKAKAEQQRRIVEQLSVAVQEYKEKHDVVSLDARRDIVTARLRAANARASSLMARLLDAETRWNRVQQARTAGEALVDLSVIAADGRVAVLQAGVAERKIALAQLANRYRDKHPRILEAAAGLASAEQALNEAVALAVMAVETDYLAARKAVEDVREELAAQERESLRLQRLAIEFEALRRELSAAERLFNTILARMSETTLSGAIEVTNARIVDRAGPAAPVGWTRHLKSLALGLAGGLAAGLGLAGVLTLLDTRVRSRRALELGLGAPVLAEVPVLPRRAGPAGRARWIEAEPRSPGAEAIRDLYCALRLRSLEQVQRVVLLTSAMGGEGKSLVAANLARCCARHGERTLLVDADLRRPVQAIWFGPTQAPDAPPGLVALAGGARRLAELVRPSDTPGLDVLLAGGTVERASSLLGSPAFRDLVNEARGNYDRIVIDAAPIGAVSDAVILLGLADACLFVVRSGRTRFKTVESGCMKLSGGITPVLGFVLNSAGSLSRKRHESYLALPSAESRPAAAAS